MAVRFLPPPGDPEPGGGPDRADLAEVIELRGMLRQRAWGDQAGAGEAPDGLPEPRGRDGLDSSSAELGEEAGVSSEPSDAADAEEEAGRAFGHGHSEPGAVAAAPVPAPRTQADREAVVSSLSDRLRPASALLSEAAESGSPEGPARPSRTASPRARGGGPRSSTADVGAPEDPTRTVYEDGVRLLARRARSSGELRQELLRLDHAAGDVDVLIDEFIDSHYLDDLGLARTVTEKLRTAKRASRSQIRIKLRDRMLPDAVIDEALGELDADEEFSLLREAAVARAAKLGGLERQVAERRLLGFLARRGWSGEPAARAAREALDGSSRRGDSGGGSGVRFR